MNLVEGQIDEIYSGSDTTMAKVRIGGAYLRVPLTFLVDAKVGDTILIESGVAIAKVASPNSQERY
jgi:hydrogenase maturation factor